MKARVADGRVNTAVTKASRSVGSILRGNILTRFNAIITSMVVVILVFGEPADALFGIVMVVNALIGIVQELRAKRTLDRLTVLVAPTATVRRSEGTVVIPAEQVVLDDLIVLARGQQVPVDGVVIDSDSIEVSEALLTGEAEPIVKHVDDPVYSGSFVVAGGAMCLVTAVGKDSYANQLALDAKKFTISRSELADSINQILRLVTWLLLPTSALLLWSQLQSGASFSDAAVSTVAGVVAMVPQGLVLLVSMAFAVAVIKLGRINVLVQELPSVETLARVDLLCVDKTGTLTDGTIRLAQVHPVAGEGTAEAPAVLSAIALADPDPNPTIAAIAARYDQATARRAVARIPFSSERKLSAVAFDDGSAWVVGAPEVVVGADVDETILSMARNLAERGRRAILVARADPEDIRRSEIGAVRPAYVLEFEEHLRPDAADTVAYFTEQHVTLKVISGDSPVTTAAVADAVAVPGSGAVDARTLPSDPVELAEVADATRVFGRVTPEQKRSLVAGFQARNHTVAMTGDGVNDVLAVKEADLGIAMGEGSGATRAVSQIVLLDNRFSALPVVVAEGRRVVANMERVSSLFLTKTVYATLLAVAIGFVGITFPFLPRHLTLIGSLTIGIPAFFLSFEPQDRPIRPGFMPRVFAFAVPAGFVTALATFIFYGLSRVDDLGLSLEQSRTGATTLMVVLGLVVLYELIEPIEMHHALMIAGLFLAYLFVLAVPPLREFFALTVPEWQAWVVIALVALVTGVLLKVLWTWAKRFIGTRYGIEVS
ncbi:MAG: HAD-IC family P-type ATPase [Acidimicrobiia bacterium]|nr:HAD-IC family P-type ATPase [Acidimicrobiia bacterium]